MNQNVNSNTDWANFRWNSNNLLFALGKARNMQGRLIGKMETLGFEHREEALLKTLTLDILKSAEIEREILNPEQLKLSIAKRLGIKISNEYISDTEVDNIVEIILDATQQNDKPLNAQTLFKWHTALFPSAERGMNKIVVCDWRSEKTNYKEVVSIEPEGKIIHFTTPDPTKLNNEMNTFFDWFNSDNSLDPLLKAGIAHLWLLTVQPFDKGNGVIAHIISNMILSKADECSQKYYSLSSQFCIKKNEYFNILEKTKKDGLDITEWLIWFLNCLIAAYNAAFIDNKNMMSNLM
ncbi:MAG: DUF4172 domain-containing protein, partial [Bacteroidetes bacterium]|nr:DUF4172 domain-containing protein [Bacteroidota bacterium]